MGAVLGLVLGLGLLLVVTSGRPVDHDSRRQSRFHRQTRELLVQAGIVGVSPAQLYAVSVVLGLVAAAAVLVVSRTYALALAFGAFAALGPRVLVVRRRASRLRELRDVWPEVVDNLASAVRAGLSLPEALSSLGVRGPEQLRTSFRAFGEDYRATGSFSTCLDRLGDSLADPVGDRIVESLRMARQVGGTDLGRLLRTLSQFLREDARTRAELETRQGWTVNAARLALAAPWAVLLLLCVDGTTITAYNSVTGVLVLAVGGGASFLAYLAMRRIGRLPEERRVLG